MNAECDRIRNLIADSVTGTLATEQARHLDKHLQQCADCCRYAEALRHEDLLLTRLIADITTDMPNRRERFLQALSRRPPRQAKGMMKWRRIMEKRITKLAVAAAVALAAVVGIYTIGHSQPAFAEVVKPILTARTAVYRLVGHMKDQPAMTIEGQFMEPAKVRHVMNFGETDASAGIQIMDYQQGKALVLVPARKMAMIMELKDQPDQFVSGMFNPFEAYRQIIRQAQENQDDSVQYLGESRIQGRKVIGYRVTTDDASSVARPGMELTIWADAESLLPLQIEFSLEKMMGEPGSVTMMDIQFDVPLDPAEFSLAVPEGYTEQTVQVDASLPTEEDLIETFRVWAELSGGRFPSELNMGAIKELEQAFADKGPKPDKEKGFDDPAFQEFLQLFQKINRGLTFTIVLREEADWHYAGADATFGDATRPIFWYRPEGSETYRVVYADLSVLDVALDDLPK